MITRLTENESVEGVAVLEHKAKRCPMCGQIKPIEGFYKNKARKDGRGTYCKSCKKIYQNATKHITRIIPTEKQCSGCRVIKPSSDFHRCRNRSDGLQSRCKDCHNTDASIRYAKRITEMGHVKKKGIIIDDHNQVDSAVRELAELQLSINTEVIACQKRVGRIIQESAEVLGPWRRSQKRLRAAIECFYRRIGYSSAMYIKQFRFGTIRYRQGRLEVELDVNQAQRCLGKP